MSEMVRPEAPVAVAAAEDGRIGNARARRSRFPVPIVIAIGLGCALSIGGYFLGAEFVTHEREARFELEVYHPIDRIRESIDDISAVLYSIRGLYAASKEVERAEFRAFVRSLDVGSAVQALEWIPRVADSDRASLEETARRDGFAGFRFAERHAQGQMVPAGKREVYFPVYYVEPYAGNTAALGFDLGSNPARLEALSRARDSGKMVATSRITLVQETGDQYGFLMFLPVYRKGAPTDTIEERRRNLDGFVLGVFRISDLVNAAIHDGSIQESSVRLQVFDKSAADGSQRLYPKSSDATGEMTVQPSLRRTRTLNVGGRDWLIVATPSQAPGYVVDLGWLPWAIFLTGLSFTALLGYYLKLSISRTWQVERLVEERTAKLTLANRELETQIIERKRAQDSLKRQAAELARSNAELEQFAYVASHDLQEPLRKVQAFGDRLRSKYADALDEQGLDYLSRMQDAAGRMQSLIQSLLNFSRIASKAQPHVAVNLDVVAQEVVSDLEVHIQETGAKVEVADLPTIEADPTQMRQIFQNLIGNALKYRREAVAPVIQISAEVLDGVAGPANGTPDKLCRIRIEDNGIGFEPEFADRIFGIFQRLHGRGEYEGTGVGLAICRKIAERHGGTITAQAQPGEGATFTVTLPVRRAWVAA
ncbi:MAG: CHASE domain-containing protein [Proteobacteria bacterium]|nr:CHASE domain-containing protein [Pseudomonadota bacterium]